MGFGALRVINDDRVEAGAGFETRPPGHGDLLLRPRGPLEHKDSSGGGGGSDPGRSGSWGGHGRHPQRDNHSKSEPVHFLQIWIVPDTRGLKPAYGQLSFDREASHRAFVLLASKDGRDGDIQVHQDVDCG